MASARSGKAVLSAGGRHRAGIPEDRGSLYGAEDEKQAESAKAGAEQLSVAPHPLLCLWYSETQPVSGRIQHEAL